MVIGTACVLAARVGLEDGQWERLYMSALLSILSAVFALYGIANEESITVHQVSLGFGGSLLAASFLAAPITILHLLIRGKRDQNMVAGAWLAILRGLGMRRNSPWG